MEAVVFYILAAVIILSAVAAITRSSAIVSAACLIVCLLGTAGIFALLKSPLIAVLQVLISAGAVMVLVIFVAMLVDMGPANAKPGFITFTKVFSALMAINFGVVVVLAIARSKVAEMPATGSAFESPATIGMLLFDKYMLPFELIGVLLLAAVIAAVVLAKRE